MVDNSGRIILLYLFTAYAVAIGFPEHFVRLKECSTHRERGQNNAGEVDGGGTSGKGRRLFFRAGHSAPDVAVFEG